MAHGNIPKAGVIFTITKKMISHNFSANSLTSEEIDLVAEYLNAGIQFTENGLQYEFQCIIVLFHFYLLVLMTISKWLMSANSFSTLKTMINKKMITMIAMEPM